MAPARICCSQITGRSWLWVPRRYLRRQEGAVAPQIEPRIAQPMGEASWGANATCRKWGSGLWMSWRWKLLRSALGGSSLEADITSNLRVSSRRFAIIHRQIWGSMIFSQYYMQIIESETSQSYCRCCLNELRHKLRPERCDLQWFWSPWAPGPLQYPPCEPRPWLFVPNAPGCHISPSLAANPGMESPWNPKNVHPNGTEQQTSEKATGRVFGPPSQLVAAGTGAPGKPTRPRSWSPEVSSISHAGTMGKDMKRHEKTTMAGRPDWGSLENSPWRKGPHGAWASWVMSSTNPSWQHPLKSLDTQK